MKTNATNERIKHEYFRYLEQARQLNEHSIDAVAKALDRFETYTKRRDFKTFHREQAIAFKGQFAEQRNVRSGEKLSKATIHATLVALKAFFRWLAGQPGYKSKLQYSDAAFFNMSLKDIAIARTIREARFPTLDQVCSTIFAMPATNAVEMRDRAVVAFTLLTGARDDASASTLLKHVDIEERRVYFDARHARTKFAKSFPTWFFPVGADIEQVFTEWVRHLQSSEGFGPDDPLFPPIRVGPGCDGLFTAVGFSKTCWSNASPIRAIFKRAFAAAGLPYFNPHSVRNTLVELGMRKCRSPEEFKAWSQNLGHEDVLTTFRSYGIIAGPRQRDLIRASATWDDDDRHALELGRRALADARAASAR